VTKRNAKPISDMDLTEVANRDMDKVAWGDRIPRRPIQNRRHSEWAKSDEKNLETLARARVGTQFGGPNMRRCEATKRDGSPCTMAALRGESVCWKHAKGAVKARLKARRLAEGRPATKATSVAIRNVRDLVKHNRLDRDLLLHPVFRALMQIVAPAWFGRPPLTLGRKITRQDLRDAALLSREMVLAWEAAKRGDMHPWTDAIIKSRALGYEGGRSPFD